MNDKKEKELSKLILIQRELRERYEHYRGVQEFNRIEVLLWKNSKISAKDEQLRKYAQNIYETKCILRGIQKQCLEIKKKIKRLNKEQVIRNKQKL